MKVNVDDVHLTEYYLFHTLEGVGNGLYGCSVRLVRFNASTASRSSDPRGYLARVIVELLYFFLYNYSLFSFYLLPLWLVLFILAVSMWKCLRKQS